jgi:hypothetical protein
MDEQAKRLDPIHAPKASGPLRRAVLQLQMSANGQQYPGQSEPPAPEQVLIELQTAISDQQKEEDTRRYRLKKARDALAAARQAGDPSDVKERRDLGRVTAEEQCLAAVQGEERGTARLEAAVFGLRSAIAADRATAAQKGIYIVQAQLQDLAAAVYQPWQEFADLLWRFDAHIQDRLSATSETQACGYQLGRGLSETYWALDLEQPGGPGCWSFLLGEPRCAELTRLVGRLAVYLSAYTAPAIAGSLEIWRQAAARPAWRGPALVAEEALYRQTRRWYELIILRQDPTTLIKPTSFINDHWTLGRAARLFWPQLITTDLVAIAVQTAPPPPRNSELNRALRNRRLTPATELS